MSTGAHKSLQVEGLRKSIGDLAVLRGIDLTVTAGQSVALLGPSGCGKTTLLRVIAGLERPQSGSVRLGDRVLSDEETFVPPERRRIGMVFQDWALFPHLDVAANVAYGLTEMNGARHHAVDGALEMVGLSGYGSRMPSTLSGGEQQRVAIARALAPRPDAILLDEPFSNLDAALRVSVRSDTRALLSELGMTTIFVTHDQEEAFVLGDEVAVMRSGVIHQQDSPHGLYSRPNDAWVATFVGEANLVSGLAKGATAETVVGSIPLAEAAVGPQLVLLRPEQLRLTAGPGARVKSVEFYGHDCSYRIEVGDTELTVRAISAPAFRTGDTVSLSYHGPGAVTYPAG